MFPDFSLLYELGIIDPGDDSDEAYRTWAANWARIGAPGYKTQGTGQKLWIVVRVLGKDYNEHIEFNEEFGMYMPARGYGELWGIATAAEQVAKLLAPPQKDPDSPYVFLVFKARFREEGQWFGLLEYLGRNKILEPENDTPGV